MWCNDSGASGRANVGLWNSSSEAGEISRYMLLLSPSRMYSCNWTAFSSSPERSLSNTAAQVFETPVTLRQSSEWLCSWSFKSITNSVQFLFCQHCWFPVSTPVYQRYCCFQIFGQVYLFGSGCSGNWHRNFLQNFLAGSYLKYSWIKKRLHTHTYTHSHTRIHTYIQTHTFIYTHTHTYIHAHIHTHIHTLTYIHTHTHIHTYIHTYRHTHTHTHTYIRG